VTIPPLVAFAVAVFGTACLIAWRGRNAAGLQEVAVACAVGAVVAGWLAVRLRGRERSADSVQAHDDRRTDAERVRRELVAQMSQDLRLPLATLRTMTQDLETGLADDPWRNLQQILAQTDRLSALVDDLSETSEVTEGVWQLVRHRVPLPELVDQAVIAVSQVAAERNVRLSAAASGRLPVDVDPGALSRAVSNLLVSAIRSSPAGATVAVLAGRAPDGWGLVAVEDRCGGVRDADLPRLFDLGWQADDASAPHGGPGVSLGLAIARGIVEAHGGTLTVRNVAGGCRFEVRVPAAMLDTAPRPRTPHAAEATPA
jgi:signal transduction histidine kinase